MSEDPHRALASRRQADQAAQRGRLAGAIAAEQGDDLALAHFEVDAMQDVALAVEGMQALGLENVHAALPRYAACTASFAAISPGVPSASMAPSARTITRSARWNTTRMSCSISTIDSFRSLCSVRISCVMS